MSDDIVARLRGHIAITTRIHYAKNGFPEPAYAHGPSSICQEAADEIERLRCERNEAMVLIETIARDVSILSSRPANIIKFSDLVDHINEWGDAARKILDKKENTDG